MHELQQQLELIFGGTIQFTSVQVNPNTVAAQFQLGHLYSHTGVATSNVILSLLINNPITAKAPGNLIHAFQGVTRHATITTVKYEQSLIAPFPIYTIEFTIHDQEGFYKDIREYCWNNFSQEFNKQLDTVLEEE